MSNDGRETPLEVIVQYPFDELIQCDLCKDGPTSQPASGRRRIFGLYQYQNHSDYKKHLKKIHCKNVLLKFKCRICNRIENDLKKQKKHYKVHENSDNDTVHNGEDNSEPPTQNESTETPGQQQVPDTPAEEERSIAETEEVRIAFPLEDNSEPPSQNESTETPSQQQAPDTPAEEERPITETEEVRIAFPLEDNSEPPTQNESTKTPSQQQVLDTPAEEERPITETEEVRIAYELEEPAGTSEEGLNNEYEASEEPPRDETDTVYELGETSIDNRVSTRLADINPIDIINQNLNILTTQNPAPREGLTRNQCKWLKLLEEATSWHAFEETVSNIIKEIGLPATHKNQNEYTRRYNNSGNRNNRRRQSKDRFDPVEAGKIQKLYRINKKKAMSKIIDGSATTYCQVDKADITGFYSNMFMEKEQAATPTPPYVAECLHQMQQAEEDGIIAIEDPIEAAEVLSKLTRTKNTAPGKDGVKYAQLKRADPGCHVLASVFNRCFQEEKTPLEWASSRTVLIHKKGDPKDLNNWRPLTLGNTIAKLYASVISTRISRWTQEHGIVSPIQKGFMDAEGCYENNFIVQSVIDDARRNGKEAVLAWLDLSNAFGSIPHKHINTMLNTIGLSKKMRNVINNMYSKATTTITTTEGDTEEIPVKAGVKQGCPLSPIIFNIAMEPLLRVIQNVEQDHGYRLHNNKQSILAYADDIVLISKNKESMQEMLNKIGETASWIGLTFNPKKCATLHVDCRKKRETVESTFTIQGGRPVYLKDGEEYEYLGVPTGYRVCQTPRDLIKSIVEDVDKLHRSLLAPWQKIEALNVFLISKLDFILRSSKVAMKPLHDADKKIKGYVKKWLHLPQRASPEVIYMPAYQGGANLTPLADLAKISKVVHAFKLLTCKDPNVKNIAWDCLKSVVKRKIAVTPSKCDMAKYLSGSIEGNFSRDGGDISSLWSQTRNACRSLNNTRMGVRFDWCTTKEELKMSVEMPSSTVGNVIVPEGERWATMRTLRAGIRNFYRVRLLRKPDQGKVYRCTTQSACSNHFALTGKYTRFCDYRFIFRARLGTVPLNGTKRFGNCDKRCRKCGFANETLPHVTNHCKVHSTAWKRRHDAIVERLGNAISLKPGESLVKNRRVLGTDSNLRPDIVLRNEDDKTIKIIDISVPFEGSEGALESARREKIHKYTAIRDELVEKGYTASVDGFIVGALGAWHRNNGRVIQTLGIARRYAAVMARLMISDTIRWSRDIYVEHVTGRRQYQQ